MQEFGPPPGKMSIDERRAHLAQVKQEYERSLTEFDSKIMEQVGEHRLLLNRVPQCLHQYFQKAYTTAFL